MANVFIQRRERKSYVAYRILYTDPHSGKRMSYKTFRNKKEADKAAHDLRSLLDTGKMPSENTKKFRALTTKDVLSSLEARWKDMLKTKELSQATFDNYMVYVRQLGSKFGKKILCNISERELRGYRAEIAEQNSNASANRMLFVFKQLMKEGIELGTVSDDYSSKIKYLSEQEHERNRFLMPEELDALIQAAKTTHAKPYLPALIWLGAEHGASRQECLTLKWGDIDFEYLGTGLIRLFRTKNKKERTEFLMPNSKKSLLSWRDHLESWWQKKNISEPASDFVFTRIDGTPIKDFKKSFASACQRAEIEDFHFHDLRHTFCSNLLLAGGQLKDVKEMIGHADIKMTDRYSHLTVEHKRVLQERLSNRYVRQEDSMSTQKVPGSQNTKKERVRMVP